MDGRDPAGLYFLELACRITGGRKPGFQEDVGGTDVHREFDAFSEESGGVSQRASFVEMEGLAARITALAAVVTAVQNILPAPERSDDKLREYAQTISLVVSGENKIGMRYVQHVLAPFDLTCLALFQHKDEAHKLLPLEVAGQSITDWRQDYITFVLRRPRGIFQDTRKLHPRRNNTPVDGIIELGGA